MRKGTARKVSFTGVPSGFQEMDMLTSGFQKSEMIIIGARPSIGKTAFALSMAANVAVTKKIPCGFFTLEMSDLSLMMRLLALDAPDQFQLPPYRAAVQVGLQKTGRFRQPALRIPLLYRGYAKHFPS